ncbi:MAG: hypothetical protein FWD39_05795 [Clostridiales bacterium]|nr:hypothetical protein [Clostridiales bacterium]
MFLLLQVWGGSFLLSLAGIVMYYLLGLQGSSMPDSFHAFLSVLLGVLLLLLYSWLGYAINDGRTKADKAALSICSLSFVLILVNLYLVIVSSNGSAVNSELYNIFVNLALWLNASGILVWGSFGNVLFSPAALLLSLLPSVFICLGYLVKNRRLALE